MNSEILPIQLWEIAVLVPIIVSFTWSAPLLFSRPVTDNANKWLGMFMLNMFVFFFATGTYYFASYRVFIFCDPLFMFSLLSIFPLIYQYVVSIVRGEMKINRKELMHFIPGLFFMLVSAFYYLFFMDANTSRYYVYNYLLGKGEMISKIRFIEMVNQGSKILFIFQALFYFIQTRKLIKLHKHIIQSYHSNLETLNIRWEKLFRIVYFTSIFIGVPVLFGGHSTISKNHTITTISMFVLGFVFSVIAWIGFTQNAHRISLSTEIEEKGVGTFNPEQLKYRLITFFNNEKPFLNPDLKIQDVYTELFTNRTYLSKLINQEFNTNFCMFVNQHRIAEAKEKFQNPEYEKYKTEQIGQQVGFNSYQSFVQAFRMFENMTPSRYRKQLCN